MLRVADRLDRALALVRHHVPGLALVPKAEVRWMRAVGRVLRPITPDFDTRFTTVLGSTVYLPCAVDDFDRDTLAQVLCHELIHQLDMQRYGPLFYVSYAVGLPVGRTARAHWERRGYAVDLMLAQEQGGDAGLERVLDHVAPLFAGPAYAWMWAGDAAARAFLAPVVAEVRSGALQRREPYAAILRAWRGA